MEELGLGPNGALLYCMEYLVRWAPCSAGCASRCRHVRVAQEDHMDDWLQDVLAGFGEDDYVLFDCPGQVRGHTPVKLRAHRDSASQVELYSHASVFRSFVDQLKSWGWKYAPPHRLQGIAYRRPRSMCVVYLLDSQFIVDAPKFISGCLVRRHSALHTAP